MNESPDKPRLKQQIFDFFPTLDRSERKELVGRITLGADGGVDFIVMMLLDVVCTGNRNSCSTTPD